MRKPVFGKLLLVIFFLSICISPVSSSFAETTENHTDEKTYSAELYAERETVSSKKYQDLLRYWAVNPEIISDTDADFPAFYGGAYINMQKNLVVQVTSLDENVLSYFANIIDITDVQFEKVECSYKELLDVHSRITKKMDPNSTDAFISSICGVGLSVLNNSVRLYILNNEQNKDETYVFKQIREKISDFHRIDISYTEERDSPAAITSAAVWPGSLIKNRSAGFWAKDGSGNIGVVTAPHSSITAGEIIKINGTVFGIAGTPYFSGNVDAVFIKRT